VTVTQRTDGKWIVTDAAGTTTSEHDTNAHAWRAVDRAANEPNSKREDTADWAWRQSLDAPAYEGARRVNGRRQPPGAA
jgi:hypothetical protein